MVFDEQMEKDFSAAFLAEWLNVNSAYTDAINTRELTEQGVNINLDSVERFQALDRRYQALLAAHRREHGREHDRICQAQLYFEAARCLACYNGNNTLRQKVHLQQALELLGGIPGEDRDLEWETVHDMVAAAVMEVDPQHFEEEEYKERAVRMVHRGNTDAPGRIHFYIRYLLFHGRVQDALDFSGHYKRLGKPESANFNTWQQLRLDWMIPWLMSPERRDDIPLTWPVD